MLMIFIEILDGALAGQKFPAQEGLRIGRSVGEIILDDPKVSALHAQVEKDAKGSLVLSDKDSANGLKIGGQRVKRVAMLPGVRFQIGRTGFRVKEEAMLPQDATDLLNAMKSKAPQSWKEKLNEQLSVLPLRNPSAKQSLDTFRPAVQLDFVQGPQFEQRVYLGYGPRQFGANVLDIEITDPACPELAFEIISDKGQPYFQTKHADLVRLNKKSIGDAALQEGDQIQIGQTILQVSFSK